MEQNNDMIFLNLIDECYSQFEKNCIRNILAKVTNVIIQMDTFEPDEETVAAIEKLSATAITLVDEVKYLENIEKNGFE